MKPISICVDNKNNLCFIGFTKGFIGVYEIGNKGIASMKQIELLKDKGGKGLIS